MSNQHDFASAIKAYRDANDLTMEQLAERIGVKKAVVWKWENGTAPSPRNAVEIEDATSGAVPRWMTRPDLWEVPEAAQ